MYDSIYCVFIFYLLFLIITMVILFKTKQFKNIFFILFVRTINKI